MDGQMRIWRDFDSTLLRFFRSVAKICVLMLFAILGSMFQTMLFATFTAPPPMANKAFLPSHVSNTTCDNTRTFAVDVYTLACCDANGAIHCLLYNNENMLLQIVWASTEMDVDEKMHILWRAREWYKKQANASLTFHAHAYRVPGDDGLAWLLSTVYMHDDFQF